MLSALCFVSLFLAYASARPDFVQTDIRPSMYMGSYVVGGEDAELGEFPWQLSQERLGVTWSHSCGASLLSTMYGLSAAHCVDGANVNNLRVKAGLYKRSDTSNAQTVYLRSYKIHERYQLDPGSFTNDIAILHFETPVHYTSTVRPALIPDDNSVLFSGQNCVISGWGRTSSSNTLPDTLQKADMTVLTNSDCQDRMKGVLGARIVDGHICVMDPQLKAGACNGDSGGPLNCQLNQQGIAVAGVASWVVSSGGNCLQTYPSVYTRVGYYSSWIKTNTF